MGDGTGGDRSRGDGTPRLAALLAPVTVDEFRARYQHRELLVSRRDDPDRYAEVLDLDMVESVVFGSNLREEHLQLLREGPVDRSEYLYPSGLVDAVAVSRLFEDGCSIVLPFAHERIATLGRLVRGLEAELGCRAQTNVYLSPPGESAFLTHYDAHDVFALQAHGEKHWVVFEDTGTVPPAGPFDAERHPPGEEQERFTLGQGDLCYLPTGLMHRAEADGISLHITVGVHWTRVSDVLTALVARVVDERSELHRAIPDGWWRDDRCRSDAVDQVAALVPALADPDLISDTLDRLREELVATRQPLVPGQLSQVTRLDDLSPTTVIARRDPLIWDLDRHDDGATLSCFGSETTFPPEAVGALEAVLDAGPAGVAIDDLDGGLGAEEKLVVARRLIREGVAEARPPDEGG